MNKIIAGVFVLLLLCFPVTTQAYQWAEIKDDWLGGYYIDVDMVKRDGDSLFFWSLAEGVDTTVVYDYYEVLLAKPYRYRVLKSVEYDYNTRQSKNLETSNRFFVVTDADVVLTKQIAAALAFEQVKQSTSVDKDGTLRFHYAYKADSKLDSYVRIVNGKIADPRGFWQALLPLQPLPGARGGYGLIGDDYLLGQADGFGLRQLGGIARRYISIESMYVKQPSGFSEIGVQNGVFTSLNELNDTTLGWVFFDLRPRFEADLKNFYGY